MSPAVHTDSTDSHDDRDQRVILHGVSWAQYEMLLDIRGEASTPRMTYLEGELELMSPSRSHEGIKKCIARLLEVYAEQRGLALNGFGAWTVRLEAQGRGLEPDECYTLGAAREDRPDLAIEVVWTSGGIGKLEVYRGLGIPEVWQWQAQRLQMFGLRGDAYVRLTRSDLLPELDVDQLLSFVDLEDQTGAARRYRAALGTPAPK